MAFVFLPLIVKSAYSFFLYHGVDVPASNTRFAILLAEELICLLVAFLLFRKMGYDMSVFGFKLRSGQILWSIGLFLICLLATTLVLSVLVHVLAPNYHHTTSTFSTATKVIAPLVIVLSIVNAYFEEFFLLRLSYHALEGRISAISIGVLTIVIRISYHTYQGVYGMAFVFIFGAIMALYYTKYRSIEAPVIVHALWDILAFVRYM